MQQNGPQFENDAPVNSDVYVSFFPHVDEFFVLDARAHLPGGPIAKVLKMSDVLKEELYQEILNRLGQVMRERRDLASLMRVPERLGWMIQRRLMRHALRAALPPERLEEQPRVSIFIVAGQAAYMTHESLEQAIEEALSGSADQNFISFCVNTLYGLFEKERAFLSAAQKEHVREALSGQSDQFYSIWENRN